jgi:hypothetical protein
MILDRYKTSKKGLNITLSKLRKINLLVGVNGSGKSRILADIERDSEYIIVNLSNTDTSTKINFQYTFSRDYVSETENGNIYFDALFDIFFDELETNQRGSQSPLLKKITRDYSEKSIKTISLKNKIFVFAYVDGTSEEIVVSNGYEKLFRFFVNLETAYNKLLTDNPYSDRQLIILIDEIGNSLHPEFQKKIPLLLNFWQSKKQQTDNKLKLQFFIATHSPFIVSSISKNFSDNHKIYLIEDGQTREIRDSKKKNTEVSNDGFSGKESMLCINQMLGVEVPDIITDCFIST